MKIKELINEMEYEILAGSEETEITTLVYDLSLIHISEPTRP